MHAAELDNFCQTILLRAATQPGLLFKHVFADIGDRFLPEYMTHMKQMMPKPQPGAGIEAKREMYKSMDKYLEDIKQEGEDIFSVVKGQPASYCLVHCQMCPTHDTDFTSAWPQVPPSLKGQPKRKKARASAPRAPASASQPPQPGPIASSSASDSTAEVPQAPPSPPLRVFVAGSSCEDWARYGARLGDAGPRMQTWLLFKAEIRAHRPQCGFCEISDACPLTFYTSELPELRWCSGVLSPFMFGWPCKRPRRFSFFGDPNISTSWAISMSL